MIKKLEVKNFKSIKYLKLYCERVNIFIGEPNTGKSNILEALGMLSFISYGKLKDFVRFETMVNLFHDQNTTESVKIAVDKRVLEMKFEHSRFKGKCSEGGAYYTGARIFEFDFDYDGTGGKSVFEERNIFKFYRFTILHEFKQKEVDFLLPPCGENLLSVLMSHKELKKMVSNIFKEYGLKMVLKPHENKIEVQKETDDMIISYPYSLVSDTLQRIIFHLAAIETNKDSVITFEEPESHAFPYYTKFLAERIALDNRNQYFISTHNPYFLLSVLEKSPKDDIAIFVTYLKGYETQVKPLNEEDKKEILEAGIDAFFNIERFLEK